MISHGGSVPFGGIPYQYAQLDGTIRAINSAGECFLYTEEVGGSNPSSPTM